LLDDIKNEELKNEIKSRRPYENIDRNISDFIKVEQDYLINRIELKEGIAKKLLIKRKSISFICINSNKYTTYNDR